MISTRQTENGEWEASNDSVPFMVVQANTQAIAVSIVERMLVWYEDRRVSRAEIAAKKLEAEVVGIGIENKRLVASEDEVMDFSGAEYMAVNTGC